MRRKSEVVNNLILNLVATLHISSLICTVSVCAQGNRKMQSSRSVRHSQEIWYSWISSAPSPNSHSVDFILWTSGSLSVPSPLTWTHDMLSGSRLRLLPTHEKLLYMRVCLYKKAPADPSTSNKYLHQKKLSWEEHLDKVQRYWSTISLLEIVQYQSINQSITQNALRVLISGNGYQLYSCY